jgi:hypothetical protein
MMVKFSEPLLLALIYGSLGLITVAVVVLSVLFIKDVKSKELW